MTSQGILREICINMRPAPCLMQKIDVTWQSDMKLCRIRWGNSFGGESITLEEVIGHNAIAILVDDLQLVDVYTNNGVLSSSRVMSET